MSINIDELTKEFKHLNENYIKVNSQLLELQQKAIQGMRIVGTGCIDETDKAAFLSLKNETHSVLTRMKEICDLIIAAEHGKA